jgi:hypothetical protein
MGTSTIPSTATDAHGAIDDNLFALRLIKLAEQCRRQRQPLPGGRIFLSNKAGKVTICSLPLFDNFED